MGRLKSKCTFNPTKHVPIYCDCFIEGALLKALSERINYPIKSTRMENVLSDLKYELENKDKIIKDLNERIMIREKVISDLKKKASTANTQKKYYYKKWKDEVSFWEGQ